MDNEDFQRGLPIGVALGVSIGAALGVAADNMALMGAGLAIGIGLSPIFGRSQRPDKNETEDDNSDEG